MRRRSRGQLGVWSRLSSTAVSLPPRPSLRAKTARESPQLAMITSLLPSGKKAVQAVVPL